MENNEVVNAQPELLGIIDRPENYIDEKLWNLCAGPLCDLPKVGEKVYYFPQGHIEHVEASTGADLNQIMPIFNLPSKIQCRVTGVQRKVDINTDEVYTEISLMPDISKDITTLPNDDKENPDIHVFNKVLTASDTSSHGGLFVPKRHALECFPPLDMSQAIPSQELSANDLHGQNWKFKHVFRGQPKRHLLTTGWNLFATSKRLVVGDCFIFVSGENGELRVGIRRARYQQGNTHSPIISTEDMQRGVIGTVYNAFNNQCMFNVFYKPRLSQFVVSYKKFVDALNNKFDIGSRFRMQFETEIDSKTRYYFGTIISVNDFSPHWKDSEWRNLQVQWDEYASFPRPDKVSPWEIEHLVNSSNVQQSVLLTKKRSRQINETGSTSSNFWISTLNEDHEIRQSSMSTPITFNAIENSKFPFSCPISYSIPSMPEPNNNNGQMIQPIKEKITTDATNSCILFGVDLTIPSETKNLMVPNESYQKSETSKLSQDKTLDNIQGLTLPKEVQSQPFNYIRTCTKVLMEGEEIGRAVDLSKFHGYNQFILELEKIFDLKGELQTRNQWKIVFTDNEGDKMLVGDDPWPEFCNMVKKIFICSEDEVNKMNYVNKFPEEVSTILKSSDVPPNVKTDN